MHYEVVSRPHRDVEGKPGSNKGALGNIDELLEECAKTILAEHERAAGVALARSLLSNQIEMSGSAVLQDQEGTREVGNDSAPTSETPVAEVKV